MFSKIFITFLVFITSSSGTSAISTSLLNSRSIVFTVLASSESSDFLFAFSIFC